MGALSNVHDQIESQLRVNLHFHLTELPKMKHFVLVEELRIKKEALTHVGKAVLNIFQLLLSIISIGLCCQLLYKAIIKAIEDYTKLPEARTLAEFYTDENR